MKTKMIDQMRTVPEIACRLYLGAKTEAADGAFRVILDRRQHVVSKEVLQQAEGIVRALKIRDREVEFASDVLELRQDSEDLFMESLFVSKDALKILFVPGGDGAGSIYRSRLPAEFMTQRTDIDVVAHHTDRLDLSKALRYDIIWIQLSSGPLLHQIASKAKEGGVKIIYDIDDLWNAVPEDNPAGTIFYGEPIKNIEAMMDLADLVTVSTKNLEEYVKQRGIKNTKVLPNMVPTPIWPPKDVADPKITKILWAGSPTHKFDLEIAAPALRDILEREDGKVRFVCFGENVPEPLESVRHFVDPIRFVDFADYAELLAKTGANFAIAPLQSNDFNRCKSAVKFLEYSASGFASICSPVGEYLEMKEKGAPIWLSFEENWEEVLTQAIKDKEWQKDVGRDAQEWVRRNNCLAFTKADLWYQAALELKGK